jgi:hypothetical protein
LTVRPEQPATKIMPKSEFMLDDPLESLMVFGRAMTDADASNLRAAIGELDGAEPVSLATAVGSNNDCLWTEMTALGWMTANDLPDLPAGTRAFRINPEAKSDIENFLAKCQHSASMTKIINDLRASVPPWLIDAVHGVDATPADLAILLGGIVESTMRRAIKPDLHDEFLREVAKVAQQMRSI